MNMPLTREQQIALMKGAPARHATMVDRLMAQGHIRKLMAQPAPGQPIAPPIVRKD